MRVSLLLITYLSISANFVLAQKCLKPTVFTWEGAQTGNKAVWKVNDTSNAYIAEDGVSIKVSIVDPYLQNTTTANPSEFGDYTKTNTFFGNGSLALQITAVKSNQPVCMEYEFSKNIVLNNFDAWDIDFIAHIPRSESTYQDSLSFVAFDKFGEVPMLILPMVRARSYTIVNQSVISGYDARVNGDLNHRDSTGAIRVSTVRPITKFVLCYANGSKDDGLSNSQAVRISSFSYCEYLGNIAGQVLVDRSFTPLSNVNVRLLNNDGTVVLDKNNLPITTTTDTNGAYRFVDISMGDYKVAIASPIGYQSSRDVDDINDNTTSVTLDTRNSNITDRNFYQVAASPLPVRLLDFQAAYLSSGNISVTWQTAWESNNDFFTVYTSLDGIDFTTRGNVSSQGNQSSISKYDLLLQEVKVQKYIYVALDQTDYDGNVVRLGIRKVVVDGQNHSWHIWPNPTDNLLNIQGKGITSDIKIEILNSSGQEISNTFVNPYMGSIDVSILDHGLYFLRVSDETGSQVMRFVKK